MSNSFKNKVIIIFIFIIALLLRVHGLNWDSNNHLHPDERFLTMVATDIKLPSSVSEYLNTALSPLNPYNYPQYQFFVYGTFPLFLTKILAVLLHLDNYNQITLLGRVLSAFFDSGNIILLYFIAKKFLKSFYIFLPSIIYTFLVLPLQLSHFFTVDTFLNFFMLLTFILLTYDFFVPASFAFALALSCKISAIYFVPIIILFFVRKYLKTKKLFTTTSTSIFCLFITFIIFRILQPYAFDGIFKINSQFIDSMKILQEYSRPSGNFPPAVQWLSKIPLLFSLENIAFWGLGLPLFIVFIISIYKTNFLISSPIISFSLVWILLIYFYQGSQFSHTMRYFLPIYPHICLLSGIYLSTINHKISKLLIVFQLIIGLGFLSIYSRSNSRVQSSKWIYQNIPISSILTNEYWDDALPLNIDNKYPDIYYQITLHPYDSDSPEKMATLLSQINSADYLIMSSNRLWASIPKVPNLYPLTTQYYQDLFMEKLNYKKIIEINSYPGFNLSFLKKCYYFGPTNFPGIKNHWFTTDDQCIYPGIYFRDDIAEEAFSVYDHPKVLIFSRRNN